MSSVVTTAAVPPMRVASDHGVNASVDSELAALLWSAQGVSSPSDARTVPSAGALYPLET